jgi:hypothetical protein
MLGFQAKQNDGNEINDIHIRDWQITEKRL